MSQHNRKDPRAKVLSMTVRYRSATLNEFIEHHSYDVSRGGLFIKTPSPFAPGTLLKFEVKIAEDQRVLQGVGRVVWKRDAGSGPDEPAGMGIKFIKLDDASKAVIERLIANRGDDTMSAFDRSPDSRSQKLFPDFGESFADDPTVVRPRSEMEYDGSSPLPPSGSGVSPLLSIPVPSGPALSMGAPVSLPHGVDSGPHSTAPHSAAPYSTAPHSAAQHSAPPRPPSRSVTPMPSLAPNVPMPSVPAPSSSRAPLKSSQPSQHRKPGPLPVTSSPPPKSGSGYIWLLLGAALAGGGFLYLKLNRHLLHPGSASPSPTAHTNVQQAVEVLPRVPVEPPSAVPAAPAGALDLDAIKPDPSDAAPGAAVPTPAVTEPSAQPSEGKAEAPEVKAAAVPDPAPVAPKPAARRKAATKEANPSDAPTAPAGADSSAAPAEPPKAETSPSPQEPAAPQGSAPAAKPEPAPAAKPESAPAPPAAEDEFR